MTGNPNVFRALCMGVLLYTIGTAAAPLTVTAPSPGQILDLGSTIVITWTNDTTPFASSVTLQLYQGTEYDRTIATSIYNGESRQWTVPHDLDTSASYRIKILWSTNQNIFGYSGSFRLRDTSAILVTSPAPGAVLSAGNTISIQWRAVGSVGSYVSIDFYRDNRLLQTITPSTSLTSYSWVVPSGLDSSELYSIRVTSSNKPGVFGVADSLKITDRWIVKVLSPTAADTLTHTASHAIRYTNTNPSNSAVRIDLLKDGVFHQMLTSSMSGGQLTWMVSSSLIPGSDYSIRVSSTAFPARADTSANFTIQAAPRLTVLTPEPLSAFGHNDTMIIGWTTEVRTGSEVRIDLFRDNLLNRTISLAAPNSGSFTWVIPSEVPTGLNYKVRVSTIVGSVSLHAESGGFSIYPLFRKGNLQTRFLHLDARQPVS